VTAHPVDVRDAAAVIRTMRQIKPAVVFHLAAYGVAPHETDRSMMTAVNVLGTLHVLQACRASGQPVLVHAGSCFEYLIQPPQASDDPSTRTPALAEEPSLGMSPPPGRGVVPSEVEGRRSGAPGLPGGLHELAYPSSKLAATGLCQAFQRQAQLPCVILRPFTAYGPYEADHRLVPSVMRALLRQEAPQLSSGEQQRDFLYVEDLVDGFLRAAVSPAAIGHAIDLGTGRAVSVREVVGALLAVTGRSVQPRFGAIAKRPSDQRTLVADPEPAQRLLGWRATTSLEDGLRRTWAWFQDRGERAAAAVSAEDASPEAGDPRRLKDEIFAKVRAYYEAVHRPKRFVPFESKVPYAGRVFDDRELVSLVDSALDFWLTLGPYGDQVEQRLKSLFGAKDAILVNSGSSANLLAVSTLLSPKLGRRLAPGDEVITPAVTFPTSLAPIVQAGLVPVFVDCEPATYNIAPSRLEEAVSSKTRAILVPHTLGNPCDLATLREVADRHRLWLIEDCCDALGSTFDGRLVGTFGDLATLSFYPAHHVTMGEGGALIVNRPELAKIARSVRDWGRDCWCAPGVSNTCGRRFQWQLGELPYGYDHKYIYSHVGYNLKPTDLQAAIGLAQLDKLPDFVARRRANFARLYEALRPYEESLILPKRDPRADPSWFGFPLTIRGGFSRSDLVGWLEEARIETRQIFAGNILRQPAYQNIPCRIVGVLEESDRVMRDAFFLGVYPGLSDAMLRFVIERFRSFFEQRVNAIAAAGIAPS
jgi:CDP-6-deoxy-D-xylo-4-hexulose-3-dehydrase